MKGEEGQLHFSTSMDEVYKKVGWELFLWFVENSRLYVNIINPEWAYKKNYEKIETKSGRAGEPVGAGCFWLLGAVAAWKKKSGASRSR